MFGREGGGADFCLDDSEDLNKCESFGGTFQQARVEPGLGTDKTASRWAGQLARSYVLAGNVGSITSYPIELPETLALGSQLKPSKIETIDMMTFPRTAQ